MAQIRPLNEVSDFWIQHAIDEIKDSYDDTVLIKPKPLNKFGRSIATNTAGDKVTVATFQDAVTNETFATDETIDQIVSTSGSDTGPIVVEGHTQDAGGNFTFVVQTVTLTGQTPADLGTDLIRCTRLYRPKGTFASPTSDFVGNIACFDSAANSGFTGGKPDVDASVKCMITAGKNQSEKCATSLSSMDYWILTGVYAAVTRAGPQSAKADIDIEFREVGGVWRPLGLEMSVDQESKGSEPLPLKPYRWIPKNSDVRMVFTASENNTVVQGHIDGVLALVQ